MPFAPVSHAVLQRTCACDSHTISGGQCSQNVGWLHRSPVTEERSTTVPPIVHEVLNSPGRPLDSPARAFFEPRFGHDFSGVRVHTDGRADESTQAVNSLAYTVGEDVVFRAGNYAPGTSEGRKLLAHELAHTVQQKSAGPLQNRLAVAQPGDAFEQEADSVAERVMAGLHAGVFHSAGDIAIQRQTPGDDNAKNLPEKKEAGEVIAEGLKTVAEQAKDNNPQVQKVVIEPMKNKLKGEWNRLSTGDKTATLGLGAATLGMAGGAMLSDPSGRKQLEGFNLAAPFTLIPYMPLSSFKYTLPSGDNPENRLLKFETSFNADDLINLRAGRSGLPTMSLGVNMQWGYDPASERLSILGADATFGVVPGLSLSAGAYKDVLRPPQTITGSEGQMAEIKKSVPEFDKPQPIPDVRIMLNVDLMKFKPGDLVRQIKGLF